MTGILMMSVGNSYGSLPVNTVAPVVSGTATVGSTLSTTNGTWTGAPAPTFTYQWQRNTSDISGATSSTYVIQAADAQNTVRCVVTATNPLGAASANSNSTATIPLSNGQAYAGGFYAGQISTAGNGVADFNLVVGPLSTAENASVQWKTSNTSTSGTSSEIAGPTNSANMNNSDHPAAQFCEGLTIGGFSDWYMPAQNELDVCYFGLKPTTASNNTGVGINANSVPKRDSNYTSGTPAQTSATAFQTGGAEAFSTSPYYWSSTENSSSGARGQYFANGGRYNNPPKTGSARVRAVRRVAV
jgi:hypothetical protein